LSSLTAGATTRVVVTIHYLPFTIHQHVRTHNRSTLSIMRRINSRPGVLLSSMR
jgi:hypothetical protein